jgi:hypothetical protein
MKWTLISKASTGINEYHLVQDGRLLIVMKYNPEQQSIRIKFEEQHLVFFVENTGYANRIIFKSVYGVDLGKFSHHHRNNTGRLQIDNEIFHYNIVENSQRKLIVHKHNNQEPLAVCQLPAVSIRDASFHERAGLVLSVSRYATMQAARNMHEL